MPAEPADVGEADRDVASVLLLRQQILDEWEEGAQKDRVLDTVDDLLMRARDKQSGTAEAASETGPLSS